MNEVYAWDMPDMPGDFFAVTVDHLFADIWSRPGLSMRDKRIMTLSVVTALGLPDLAEIQVNAALHNGEMTESDLREMAVFITHYVGFPHVSRGEPSVTSALPADCGLVGHRSGNHRQHDRDEGAERPRPRCASAPEPHDRRHAAGQADQCGDRQGGGDGGDRTFHAATLRRAVVEEGEGDQTDHRGRRAEQDGQHQHDDRGRHVSSRAGCFRRRLGHGHGCYRRRRADG